MKDATFLLIATAVASVLTVGIGCPSIYFYYVITVIDVEQDLVKNNVLPMEWQHLPVISLTSFRLLSVAVQGIDAVDLFTVRNGSSQPHPVSTGMICYGVLCSLYTIYIMTIHDI